MKSKARLSSALSVAVLLASASAVELNPLFQDHAVLQCDARVPVWGAGRDGEAVTVAFAGQTVSTTAENGAWKVWLEPMQPTASPRTLSVTGDNTFEISDVLVGEVWIASGQSNMERRLGLQPGQKPIHDWENELAAADYPQIRQFYVPHVKSYAPQIAVAGSWTVCSPDTVEDFSAVAYFFARDLHLARNVPVGIVHSSWGGTPAESWTSEAGLRPLPDFAEPLAEIASFRSDPSLAQRKKNEAQLKWLEAVDPAWTPYLASSVSNLNTDDWRTIDLPATIENSGYPGFDGIIWHHKEFTLPPQGDFSDAQLHLGAIDDMDTTWINGIRIGMTSRWDTPRVYPVPSDILKPGKNKIVVRVLDTYGNGGVYGGDDAMRLEIKVDGEQRQIPLAGPWKVNTSISRDETGWPPAAFTDMPSEPTVLFNAMIHPLLPYAMRGVIWYQGEANVGRERQYQTLFPAMIADWRRVWGQGDFPFLFVQIAPYRDMTPEIREAQLLSLKNTDNTAMVVTIDCGDAEDIHPTRKQPVGARLALAAQALAYGENIEYSGPIFDAMEIQGSNAVLSFSHTDGGLVAKDGELKGFTIAGSDKIFHPAQARIVDDTVVVNAAEVLAPVAVRYGWANVPEGNLYNKAGLPASPFRTDVE